MKIRRVIVGLDPAPQSRALLEAAAEAAEQMEAELVGLFVENVDLLHFAGLPFAREVGITSAVRRELDVEAMERSLRGLAREAQRLLASVAERTPVRWSFRVSRGSLMAELLAAAEEADLVIAVAGQPAELGEAGNVRVVHAGDPDELLAALEEATGGVLVLTGSDDARLGEALRKLSGRDQT